MAVENTSTVDAVGTDKETGEVRISIFGHLPWDTEHLRLLQDIILGTLASSSPVKLRLVPERQGRSSVIDVHTKFRPTEDSARLLKQAEAATPG